MGLIADIFLIAGAIGATLYCYVLSRRLAKFNDLEKGVGGAVAVLSAQVDDMTKTLRGAQVAAVSSTSSLDAITVRAEGAAARLELLVASMHDLPVQPENLQPPKTAKPENAPEDDLRERKKTDAIFVRHKDTFLEAAE